MRQPRVALIVPALVVSTCLWLAFLVPGTAAGHANARVVLDVSVHAAAGVQGQTIGWSRPLTDTIGTEPGLAVFLPFVELASGLEQTWPADGSTEQSPNVFLTWHLENRMIANPSFAIYLEADDDTPDALLVDGLTKTSYDPFTFDLNTTYYWQVIARGTNGVQVESPVRSFTIEGPFDPAKLETMIPIAAGEFQMGCDPWDPLLPRPCEHELDGRDSPLHAVYLDAYEIDKYEVTNQQYQSCVAAGECDRPLRSSSHDRDSYYGNPDYDYYPVLFVSWWDAQDYCEWKGKRLPTEAQWEKAARGVIDTRAWPWGHEFPDCTRQNFTNDWGEPWARCLGDTDRVGSYPAGASPFGLMDVSGNAFEWVADIWDPTYYSWTPYANPTGPKRSIHPDSGPIFVIRGGSYRPRWYYGMTNRRQWGHHGISDDQPDSPYYRNNQVGFRCARPLPSD